LCVCGGGSGLPSKVGQRSTCSRALLICPPPGCVYDLADNPHGRSLHFSLTFLSPSLSQPLSCCWSLLNVLMRKGQLVLLCPCNNTLQTKQNKAKQNKTKQNKTFFFSNHHQLMLMMWRTHFFLCPIPTHICLSIILGSLWLHIFSDTLW
jgi:hypothetical protein